MFESKLDWQMPKIPNLKGEENLDDWDRQIRNHLRLHRCLAFVDKGSVEPTQMQGEMEADFHDRLEA